MIVVLSLSECTIEHSYFTKGIILNESGVPLKIHFYKEGISNSEFQVAVSNGERKQVSAEEIFTYAGLLARGDFDSLVVDFDHSRKSVHYGFGKTGTNQDAILYDNQRSLFNEKNYVKQKIVDKKYKHESEYVFTITEQDYRDAR